MFKNGKTGGKLRAEESEKRTLRMLGLDQAFQASPVSAEGIDQENICEGSRKDVRTAMLEAEYWKVKAMVAFQNNRRFY